MSATIMSSYPEGSNGHQHVSSLSSQPQMQGYQYPSSSHTYSQHSQGGSHHFHHLPSASSSFSSSSHSHPHMQRGGYYTEQSEDWALVDFLLAAPVEDRTIGGGSPNGDSTGSPHGYTSHLGNYDDEKQVQHETQVVTLAPFDIDFSSLRPFLNPKHLDYPSSHGGAVSGGMYEHINQQNGYSSSLSAHPVAQHSYGSSSQPHAHNPQAHPPSLISYHPNVSTPAGISPQDSVAAAYVAKMSPMVSALEGVVNMVRIGQHKEKVCSVQNCGKLARSRGLCMRHGGGRRCEVEGCQKGSQSGGRCIAHGGGKRCRTAGCLNAQQSDGLCIAHGGGKRCVVPGCTKSSQRRGFCHVHGGGQSCTVANCSKGAQRNGLCVEHGGRRYCKFEKCQKTARGGGFCIAHGGDTRCKAPECNKIAKEDGLCTLHLFSPGNDAKRAAGAKASSTAKTSSGVSTPEKKESHPSSKC